MAVMLKLLSMMQREQYATEGFLCPIRVLSTSDAHRFRVSCDELERNMGGKPRTIQVRQMHLHFPWAWELATHPQILDAVEDILGPDLIIWATELFSKHAYDSKLSIGWHRDRPYMGFAQDEVVTAWVSLGRSIRANGCMCVLPRSLDHLGGEVCTPGVEMPQDDIRAVELEPGEMSLHDPEILHGSWPNTSGEKRVGFVIRFVAPSAKPLSGRPKAVLARGRDRYDHFEIVDRLNDSAPAQALAEMAASAATHLDVVLDNLRQTRPTKPTRAQP
jgi:non-heme Fe2+,alpha-ketoglutarate-dependent halogenase